MADFGRDLHAALLKGLKLVINSKKFKEIFGDFKHVLGFLWEYLCNVSFV